MLQAERSKYLRVVWWLMNHPVEALYIMLGLKLSPHQRICFREMWFSRSVGLMLSRGLSKTFLLGCYLVLRMMLKRGAKQVALTSGFRGGKIIFREAIQPLILGTLDGQERKLYAVRCLENYRAGIKVENIKVINKDPDLWAIRSAYNAHITTGPLGKEGDDGQGLRGLRGSDTLALDESKDIGDKKYNTVIRPFARVRSNPVNDYPGEEDDTQNSTFTKIEAGTVQYDWQRFTRELHFIKDRMQAGDRDYVLLEFNYEDCFHYKGNKRPLGEVDIREEIKRGHVVMPYRLNFEDLFDELQNGATSLEDFFSENKNRIQASVGNEFPVSLLQSVTGVEVDPRYIDQVTDEDSLFYDPQHVEPTLFPVLKSDDLVVIGADPARVGDDFGLVVIRPGVLRRCNAPFNDVLYAYSKNKLRFSEMADKIRETLDCYPGTKAVYLDAGGGGLAVRDELWFPDERHPGLGYLPLYDPNDPDTPPTVKERGLPILRMDNATNELNTFRVNFARAQMQSKRLMIPGFLYSTGDQDLDQAYRDIRQMVRQFTYIVSEPSGNYKRYYTDNRLKKDLFSACLLALQGIYDITVVDANSVKVVNECEAV